MAANAAVTPGEAGRTPLPGAPNGEAVVLPPQDVTINIPENAVINSENEIVRYSQVCEQHINHLVDMQIKEGENLSASARKRLVAVEALKEWKEAEKGLLGKVERRTKQTGKIIFELYQLVGLYSVFVGVVFTAVLQSPLVRCQHIWIPVVLCVFSWLIIILVTTKRLRKYNDLLKTIGDEEKARSAIYEQIGNLKLHGYKIFDFQRHAREGKRTSSGVRSNLSTPTICGMQVTAARVIPFVLTALTLILIGSFIHILCLQEIAARL